jgi:nitroreductase
MNAVIENIRTRRSIRSYEQRQIPADDLRAILEAASFAPSAMATQGWLFTALQSPEALKKANDALRQTLRNIPITEGMNPRMAALIEKSKLDDSEFLYGAPTYIIVSHDAQNPNAMADWLLP